MTDLPWEWTEREQRGRYDLKSWSKDWMRQVCQQGLKLHVVISMREFPPWIKLDEHPEYCEKASNQCPHEPPHTPSPTHPEVRQMLEEYVGNTTRLLLETYGADCLATVSPTLNNEFETRYSQTNGAIRDYAVGAIQNYHHYQKKEKKKPPPLSGNEDGAAMTPLDPPTFGCMTHCTPLVAPQQYQWFGYRDIALAEVYLGLCQAAKHVSRQLGRPQAIPTLLHFGEMFASTDHFHANLFFHLAASDAVDHLVMDSNMMLAGAPASPGVVGVLLSAARLYPDKTIHYELATERVLPCDDNGQLLHEKRTEVFEGAHKLTQAGIEAALEASVHSLGVTNLCQPSLAVSILPLTTPTTKTGAATAAKRGGSASLLTSEQFQPTAVIYVPYRVYYAYSFLVTGVTCDLPSMTCWHPSFARMPFFGLANAAEHLPPDSCPLDAMQMTLVEAWEELRTRHKHVAVVGDVTRLQALAAQARERVLIRYPCVMTDTLWHIYEGETTKQQFDAIAKKYPFNERLSPLSTCK